ncbi:MAG: chalcone isomerase family protein [Bacteroidota bacterium]
MKNLFFTFLLLLCFQALGQHTVKIQNVEFFKTITVGEQKLVVNGGGLREKYWFDLYVAALYLKTKSTDASRIINKHEEMAIYIKLVSDKVTREKFIETVREGFANATAGKATKEEIKKFTGFFTGEFKNGDKIYLEYIPEKGLQVEKNGKHIGTIEGLEFKKALFSIWLGSKTVDETLRDGMLGKE